MDMGDMALADQLATEGQLVTVVMEFQGLSLMAMNSEVQRQIIQKETLPRTQIFKRRRCRLILERFTVLFFLSFFLSF